MKHDFDVIVIGGGAAGLTSSGIAASFGAKTALIEAKKLGGDCTWYGCIPSKTLLKAAKIAHQFRTASRYGLHDLEPEFVFDKVIEHVHRIQQHVYHEADAPDIYERFGVKVVQAHARFRNPHTLELTDREGKTSTLTSRYFVVAAGSSPVVPSIEGISDSGYLTNETIFSIKNLPRHLIILGAGPIGAEMSQAFRRFGSDVTVIQSGDRILSKDDSELAHLLKRSLESEGVRFVFESEVQGVRKLNGNLEVTVRSKTGGSQTRLNADALLLAVGRRPNVEGLNLEAAGIAWDKRGIIVNNHCRTSANHIFACGDIAGRFQFTHFAEHMAKVALTNALLHLPVSLDSRHITWCTFTDPELAHIGLTEKELLMDDISYEVYRFPFSKIDRAITDNEPVGWIKVYARKWNGRIYGANILGANAGEMIGEFALATRHGITLRKIADTIHPYPTYVLGNRRAADQWYVRKQSRMFVRMLQKVLGLRGQLPDTSDPKRIL
jgi:pyruvate/2-oxoglutarate dehydrogenase complex dihydrolipoamide dehydrogenase (E3) component